MPDALRMSRHERREIADALYNLSARQAKIEVGIRYEHIGLADPAAAASALRNAARALDALADRIADAYIHAVIYPDAEAPAIPGDAAVSPAAAAPPLPLSRSDFRRSGGGALPEESTEPLSQRPIQEPHS